MNKDIILAISPEQGQSGGCWYHRIATIADCLNANKEYGTKVITTPTAIFDSQLLERVRCVFVQRPVWPAPWLKNYKELQPKYGYSIVRL
jgi:hypothetical protein